MYIYLKFPRKARVDHLRSSTPLGCSAMEIQLKLFGDVFALALTPV